MTQCFSLSPAPRAVRRQHASHAQQCTPCAAAAGLLVGTAWHALCPKQPRGAAAYALRCCKAAAGLQCTSCAGGSSVGLSSARRGVHPSRTPLSPQLCFRGTRIRFYLLPQCSGAISCLSADRGYARLVYPRTSVAQPRVADRRGNTMMMLPRLADTAPNVSEDRGYASPV